MLRRATSQKRIRNPEIEVDMQEHESEAVKDREMEQQAGDNEETRGGLNLQNLLEFMAEQNKQMLKQINEKINSTNESTNESLRQIKKNK